MKRYIVFLLAIIMLSAFAFSSACDLSKKPSGNIGDPSYSGSHSANEPYIPQPASGKTTDLMLGYTAGDVQAVALENAYRSAYNAFTADLFKRLYEGKNELISPLSIQLALSMTANGAAGATKTQMEAALFGGDDLDVFNAYNMSYVKSITEQTNVRINVANSIWFKDDPLFTVKGEFLQKNADYYDAAAYKSPFNDDTLKDINGWVSNKTDGMIDKILDDISKDAIMYLINAVLFDAEWSMKFEAESDEYFTCADGTKKQMTIMRDEVSGYLESDFAEGFVKYYKGGRFAFAAMLPKDGYTVKSVVESLTGEKLTSYFASKVSDMVALKMPKFKLDYEADLNDYLIAMGMEDAFDPNSADFSKLGAYNDANIYIDFVKHKTAIEVGEAGTKAAAVTAVGIAKGTAVMPEPKIHYVYLTRPFIYFLLDTETNTPLFMGTFEK